MTEKATVKKRKVAYVNRNDFQRLTWQWVPRKCPEKFKRCPWFKEARDDDNMACDSPRPGKNCLFEKRLWRRLLEQAMNEGVGEFAARQLATVQVDILRFEAAGDEKKVRAERFQLLKLLLDYGLKSKRFLLDERKISLAEKYPKARLLQGQGDAYETRLEDITSQRVGKHD